ncbi:hypothetical protein HDU77_005662 [Chytriomyces hyalinus]|nr:hypothetical protein HDU77_005662 [Chytriomyces hyalinus]
MASTQQQQQQDNWFASIEQEVLQKQSKQQQQPTRRTAPTTPSTFIASAPLSANSGAAAPRPPSLDHNRDDYFARQSCVNSGAQTRNAPQQKDPTYQQRLMAMIPDTSSISLNSLSLSNVIPASVPNIQNIFGRSTSSPTKQMESSAATGFGNSSSSYHSPSKLASSSPERLSFLSSSSNPPSSNVASAYPSSNSMLTSTYNSTKAAVASFSSGFSSDSATSSQYAPVGSSGKVSQAYQGQTSLLSSTKAAVSKLAQTVTSATMGVSSSKSLPTRSGGAYGLGGGGGSNHGGPRDSSSTLYDRGGTPTISSWSKANDSWGGFADEDGEKSLFMSGAEEGGRLRRGSVGAGAGESLQPW